MIEARRKVHELEQRLSIVTATVDSEGENIKSLRKAVENQEKEASKVKVDAKELEAKKKLAEEFEKSMKHYFNNFLLYLNFQNKMS